MADDCRFYGYMHWTLEDTPRCFYVGKGRKRRPFNTRQRNHKWFGVVKRFGLRVEVCTASMINSDACTWEILNIERMGTFSKVHGHDDPDDIGCNFTRGGEGNLGGTRHNISALGKAKKGIPLSPTHRAKLSSANTGKTVSDDVRSAISKSLTGREFTDEHRQHIRDSASRRKMPSRSIEHREKHAAALRGKKYKKS